MDVNNQAKGCNRTEQAQQNAGWTIHSECFDDANCASYQAAQDCPI